MVGWAGWTGIARRLDSLARAGGLYSRKVAEGSQQLYPDRRDGDGGGIRWW